MPTVDEMSRTSIAFALASVTSVKIIGANPIVTDPDDLDTPTLDDLGIKDADGVRLFMTMLVSFVPDEARQCVGKIRPAPNSVVGEIEQLVENCIAAIPATGHMAFAQASTTNIFSESLTKTVIARRADKPPKKKTPGKDR